MPLQNTSGNDTTDAYGGGAAAIPNYIEDVFSTWLYTGAGVGTPISLSNGINISDKGGLVWLKCRGNGYSNYLSDTANGNNKYLITNDDGGATTQSGGIVTFNTNGVTVTGNTSGTVQGYTYASWTFCKQPKFFDVVTYTGTGSNTTIAHNLGSVPGCIIVKRTDTNGNWQVYHNGLTSAAYSIQLNLTSAQASATTVWNSTAPTSTVFSVGTDATVNASGGTYVAYIFAHNAGGFGLTGTDNVISCGSLTTSATAGLNYVTLGYEPQFVMLKRTNGAENWLILDVMRAMSNTSYAELYPNNSNAEGASSSYSDVVPTATGFALNTNTSGTPVPSGTYIYIAIRRGPMKVPTDATKVFNANKQNTTGTTTVIPSGFPPDMVVAVENPASFGLWDWQDRLRGSNDSTGQQVLQSDSTSAEIASSGRTALTVTSSGFVYQTAITNLLTWAFRRAPSFFDEVCSAGTSSSNQARTHNLGVVPELIIAKDRTTGVANWAVYLSIFGQNKYLTLNTTNALNTSAGIWGTTTNTATTFYCADTSAWCFTAGDNGVFYLFATCAGVSKVGSYTGNGSTQTIACGFAGGARFVLIKRTDSTGNWGVLDTARGMVSGTDPYLNLNTTSAEVNANNVYTTTGGFQLVSSDANFNANGGSYIFLAVA